MPKYKVVLTVQDSFGMPKEVDGGTIDIDLAEALTATDVKQIEEALPLEDYIKKAELSEELNTYATDGEVEDAVTFTTDKFVTNAFGDYAVGDSVKGHTITAVLAKLLGLVDNMPQRPSGGELPDDPQPDEPERPEEPEQPDDFDSITDAIIANKTPMYSVDNTGNIIAVSYENVIIYAADEPIAQPTEFGFYQIVGESGDVTEAGYQELTAENPDVPYIIALPSGIDFNTMVTVQTYDSLENKWKNDSFEMSNDLEVITGICDELGIDISHIDADAYTIWADLEAGPTGKIHRFIITE